MGIRLPLFFLPYILGWRYATHVFKGANKVRIVAKPTTLGHITEGHGGIFIYQQARLTYLNTQDIAHGRAPRKRG